MAKDGQADDARSFELELRPLIAPAYRLALGMLHHREEAEDVVQEAALKAWKKFGNLREGSEMKPWFLAIVANQCRTVRRARWWSILKIADPQIPVVLPEEQVVQTVDLRRGLRRLTHDQQLVLILHYYLDLPFEDVAAVVDVSVEAAKSRIYRTVRELRVALAAESIP
jgi:RNA polymerase sigma-70 factor (ECF subfamily)